MLRLAGRPHRVTASLLHPSSIASTTGRRHPLPTLGQAAMTTSHLSPSPSPSSLFSSSPSACFSTRTSSSPSSRKPLSSRSPSPLHPHPLPPAPPRHPPLLSSSPLPPSHPPLLPLPHPLPPPLLPLHPSLPHHPRRPRDGPRRPGRSPPRPMGALEAARHLLPLDRRRRPHRHPPPPRRPVGRRLLLLTGLRRRGGGGLHRRPAHRVWPRPSRLPRTPRAHHPPGIRVPGLAPSGAQRHHRARLPRQRTAQRRLPRLLLPARGAAVAGGGADRQR